MAGKRCSSGWLHVFSVRATKGILFFHAFAEHTPKKNLRKGQRKKGKRETIKSKKEKKEESKKKRNLKR